jgi:hypothetical protein
MSECACCSFKDSQDENATSNHNNPNLVATAAECAHANLNSHRHMSIKHNTHPYSRSKHVFRS